MTTTIQTFANGDTNYVAKLNANFSAVQTTADAALTQAKALAAGVISQLPLFQALFGTSTALIGPGSYLPTTSSTNLIVAAGYAWLAPNLIVVGIQTSITIPFSGLAADTYYLHIGNNGAPSTNTTAAQAVYSIAWTGSAFGAITLLVPEVDIEYMSHKGQANGYAGLDGSGHLSVAQGGTGAGTFTAGYLKANGTSAFTTVSGIAYSDVSGLGSAATHAASDFDASGAAAAALASANAYTDAHTSGMGSVSSVGLSMPAMFTVTNSPVTGSGTLTATLATQSANVVFAGPTSGAAAAPTWRSLVAGDVPTLNQNTTGSAAKLTTARSIGGVSFDGSADIAQPYDLYGYFSTKPTASQVIWIGTVPRTVVLPASLTGSYGKCLDAATASTVFDIQVNGVSKGSMTFGVGGTTATFTFASPVTLSAGDVVQIIAPASPDATCGRIYQTLVGTRT
jgi:hypothetical protein